jgi:hypothetical protein
MKKDFRERGTENVYFFFFFLQSRARGGISALSSFYVKMVFEQKNKSRGGTFT